MDEPAAIQVSHLEPGASVEVALRSVDAGGTTWTSRATFTADQNGIVDPGLTAPTAGSYLGVWGMGLFTVMNPAPVSARVYRWPSTGGATFEVSAHQGDRTLATASLTRTFWTAPAHTRSFTMAEDGFVGTYVAPAGARRGPAVMVLGGSEGGDPASGAMILAARGIPALSVAYFKAPGLPQELTSIPLEYFDTPLRWLRDQPAVDPARLWIFGGSRGSEAAALVAVDRPELVHGLLAMSPSATANCAYVPSTGKACPGPAWLRGVKPVPYTAQFDNPNPSDHSDAVIAVEGITGPVLTVCGDADVLWNSCAYSKAIQDRLENAKTDHRRLALSYPNAGHAVDFPMPYQPFAPRAAGAAPTDGSTPTANDQARADLWPKLLDFIRTAT